MNSVSAMVASCGCALITSFKGLTYSASTPAVLEFKGTELPWKRDFTGKSIGLGPYGRSRLSQQKPASVHLSQTFLTNKSAVGPRASSNARVSASKDKPSVASKGKTDRQSDKSRSEVGIKGKNHKQEGKTGMSSANMSESTSTAIATRQVVVKDGFAGLSALKAHLEQERPRISRVKGIDVGHFPHQRHKAELRRRQEADESPTSPKFDEFMTREASSPSKLTSSDGRIRDGDTTTKAAAWKEVTSFPPPSSSSSSSLKKELSKGNPRIKKQGGGLRQVWKGQPSSSQTDVTELISTKESSSSPRFRTQNGGKLDPTSNYRTTDTEAVENFTLGVERDTAEMGRSSSNINSLNGLDSQSATKLSGESVLEALKRAAALRDNKVKSRRKVRPGGGKYSSDSDSDDDSKQDLLPPLVFKPEWASKIEELEKDLKQLRMLS